MPSSASVDRVPAGPILVVGRVVRGASPEVEHGLLVDDLMACCVAHSVGFRLAEDGAWQDGAWVAVFGRMVPTSDPSLIVRAPWRKDRMLSVAGGYRLQVERAVPAEQIMFPDNVVDLLGSSSLNMFRRALRESGLDRRLRAEASITILAPVDAAFERLSAGERAGLFNPSRRDALTRFVLRHVVAEGLSRRALAGRGKVTMLDGSEVAVETLEGKPVLEGSRYLFGDQRGRNGYVHLIMPSLPPARGPAPAGGHGDPLP
jgi:uncharacterized surface protein with fasciclin (FAS1) repeats